MTGAAHARPHRLRNSAPFDPGSVSFPAKGRQARGEGNPERSDMKQNSLDPLPSTGSAGLAGDDKVIVNAAGFAPFEVKVPFKP